MQRRLFELSEITSRGMGPDHVKVRLGWVDYVLKYTYTPLAKSLSRTMLLGA